MLRGKGIHYDTGTFPNGDSSRPVFDSRDAERDMRVIAKDLHCTAVRITGGDPDRIETTARYAAQEGLEVWFSPFPCELTNAEMLPLFADCAERAERLRRDGAEAVLVAGCELSLFARGYLPGDTFEERVPALAGPGREAALQGVPAKVNAFLGEVVDTVRPLFAGRVSYASCPLDDVDWTPFDVVGLDAFRGLRNAATYRDEQVRYLDDLMTVFEEEGVDSVFWFSFAGFATPHRPSGPDEDLASYGIVKILDEHSGHPADTRTYPGMPWEPKEAFFALANRYGRLTK
ncbi:hypothetical protein [Streptomyces sp. NPDC004629]|uniref:hypothetical protein n=1 Tax=Streptomyces sp. NPDC004629 TaxID=3364705 RepID=UPI0036BC0CF8